MTSTPAATASASELANDGYTYDIDDIAQIYVGRITTYQHQPKTRTGTTIDRTRQRELRRHLNRTTL